MDAGTATGQAQAEDGGGGGVWRQRVDWRSGKLVAVRDDAFWQEHERRRLEQGLGVAQYCQVNGLALSTYRHRTSGRRRGRAPGVAPAAAPAAPATGTLPGFIAVPPGTPAAAVPAVEIALEGMTLRLAGAAADRIVECVLSRLAS